MKKLFLPPNSDNSTRQAGFSLVELMVGLTIGLLASVIIMQVISNFEAQKRATTGVADAQTNGNIALQNISREIQQAGYGLYPLGLPSNQGPADSPLECSTLTINGVNDATTPNRLTPVFIADDGQSDSITIRYGDTTSGGLFTSVNAAAGTQVTVASTLGCRAGNATLIVNGATCSMSAVSGVVNATTLDMVNTTGAIFGTQLACLGTWNEITYAVNADGALTRTTLGSAAVVDVEEIVNLQAQYGISATPNSNTISQWVEPTASGWTSPTVNDRNRIKAIRVAVVARNTKKEAKDTTTNPSQCVTTQACTAKDTASQTGLCAWEGTAASPSPTIDLSTFDADWGCYRYRVFETILPLRNVIWSGGTL